MAPDQQKITLTLKDGTILEPVGLDRDEIRELRKKKLDPAMAPDNEDELTVKQRTADMVDFMIDTLFPDKSFRGVPYGRVLKFAMACYGETFGDPDEVKNSSPSTPGTQAEQADKPAAATA